MAIRVYREWQGKMPYYLRFTCEKCGCRTHWLNREYEIVTRKQEDLAIRARETI